MVPRMVAKDFRPKKSPIVAQTIGNDASMAVKGIVKSQRGQRPVPQISSSMELEATSIHMASSLGRFMASASQPIKKWAAQFKNAKAPSKKAACSWVKPFHTIIGM